MVKINFQNNVTKASAETFNTMQDNIENAIPTIDDQVSTSSTNGVENQAITNYVDNEISGVQQDITDIQNDLYDTGWVDLEYRNQDVWQRTGDIYKVQIRRWGRLVQIKGQLNANNNLSDNQSLAIPSSRLAEFYTGNMEIQIITNTCFYWIESNGVLHITSSQNQYINIGGVYMYA